MALEIDAMCGMENLFDQIAIMSGAKMIGLLFLAFMSINKKHLGMLIIFGSIVLSVFEERDVAPVDQNCTAMNGDYKKELVVFLFFVYGIYAELRYLIYFITFAIYAIQKPTIQYQYVIPVMVPQNGVKQALLMI